MALSWNEIKDGGRGGAEGARQAGDVSGKQPFVNDTKRIEFLFELYERYTAGLFVKLAVESAGGTLENIVMLRICKVDY